MARSAVWRNGTDYGWVHEIIKPIGPLLDFNIPWQHSIVNGLCSVQDVLEFCQNFRIYPFPHASWNRKCQQMVGIHKDGKKILVETRSRMVRYEMWGRHHFSSQTKTNSRRTPPTILFQLYANPPVTDRQTDRPHCKMAIWEFNCTLLGCSLFWFKLSSCFIQ